MKPIFKELTEDFYELLKKTSEERDADIGEVTIEVAEYLKKLYFIEEGSNE